MERKLKLMGPMVITAVMLGILFTNVGIAATVNTRDLDIAAKAAQELRLKTTENLRISTRITPIKKVIPVTQITPIKKEAPTPVKKVTPKPTVKTPNLAVKTPTPTKAAQQYIVFGNKAAGFKSGMSDNDKKNWDKIVSKYEAGDDNWNKDTNLSFRMSGNFCSYVDEDGNINGWLYAANGTDGYVPVSKGKVMETGLPKGTTYYSPDGNAYVVGKDGTLTLSGNVDWVKYGSYVGPSAGYHYNGGYFLGINENGQYQRYYYDEVTNSDLERFGYYKDGDAIMPINDQYRQAQAIKNGEISFDVIEKVQALKRLNN